MTRISTYWKQIQEQTERFIKHNWGFPFIAAFLILLFTAAVFFATSANLRWVAEGIAVVAYFTLVIGVLFQLGNVNFKTVHETPMRLKKLKVSLQHILEKNKKEGVGVHGSG